MHFSLFFGKNRVKIGDFRLSDRGELNETSQKTAYFLRQAERKFFDYYEKNSL